MVAIPTGYSSLFEQLSDPVMLIRRDRSIAYANPAAAALLGWSAAELIGMSLSEIIPKLADHAKPAGRKRPSRRAADKLINLSAQRHDGSELPIELSLSEMDSSLTAAVLRERREQRDREREVSVTGFLRAAIAGATQFAAITDPLRLSQAVVKRLALDFDAVSARIWVIEGKKMRVAASIGPLEDDTISSAPVTVASFTARVGVVARSREAFISNDPAGDELLDSSWLAAHSARSVAFLPLLHGKRLFGVLVYLGKQKILPEMGEALRAFALMVGAAVHDTERMARLNGALSQIKQSETRLRLAAIVESSDDAILSRSLDGTILSWNPGAEKLYGYSADEMLGQPIEKLVPADRSAEVRNILARVLSGQTAEHFETLHLHKDGTLLSVSLTISPVRNNSGEVIGASTIARDISEITKAEKARDLLAAVVEAADSAILSWSLESDILTWNKACEQLYGHSADEMIGQSIRNLVPPEHPDEIDEILAQIRAGESIEDFETLRLHKDGSLIPVSLTISPVRDSSGAVIGASTTSLDMREINRLIEAAKSARSRFLAAAGKILGSPLDYKTTLPQLANLIISQLADWCIIYAPDPQEVIYQQAMVHSDAAKLALMEKLYKTHPTRTAEGDYIGRVLLTGEAQFVPVLDAAAMKVISQSEPERQAVIKQLAIHSMITVPLISHERILGALTLARAENSEPFDDDDMVLAEDLASRIGQAIDNARLFAEAEKAIRSRNDFLSLASHELRTPITVTVGNAQLLTSLVQRAVDAAEPGADRVEVSASLVIKRTSNVEEAALSLSKIGERLLDVTRLQRGVLEITPEQADLRAIMARVVAAARLMQAHGRYDPATTISAELPAKAVWGTWDEERLVQVFNNLIDNALKYSPEAGLVKITMTAAGDDGPVSVTIADNGIGIPLAQQGNVFEPYARASNATSASLPGFGMGLALCKTLIELHGGKIALESAGEGAGSIFRVELPRHTSAKAIA